MNKLNETKMINDEGQEVSSEDVQAAGMLDGMKKNNELSSGDTVGISRKRYADSIISGLSSSSDVSLKSSEGMGHVKSGGKESHGSHSKRKKITKVLARSRDNIHEYKLTMSIESKKKVIACLHLLKLANKQLTDKVSSLQEVVTREQEHTEKKKMQALKKSKHKTGIPVSSIISPDVAEDTKESISTTTGVSKDGTDGTAEESEGEEEFFDAPEHTSEQSQLIQEDVVCTVRKVYSVVSKFIGNSLPEPTRSAVRECLLTLPSNWSQTASASTAPSSPKTGFQQDSAPASTAQDCLCLSSNLKVLILAKESLEMVKNVSDALDGSLGRAEEWVKEKQMWKEELRNKLVERDRQFRLEDARAANAENPSQAYTSKELTKDNSSMNIDSKSGP